MIDALLNTLDHTVKVLLGIFGRELTVAVMLGLLTSGLSVFFIKNTPGMVSSERRVLYTRFWAVVTGFVLMFLLYAPELFALRFFVSLMTGLAAPVLYRFTVYLYGKRYGKDAKDNLSADPLTLHGDSDEASKKKDRPRT